jgi:hypothetical protein
VIDLQNDILTWIGPGEQEIISRARLLLKIGKPPSDIEKEIHRGKLIIQQAELVNLEANVYFHLANTQRAYDSRKFDIYDTEYRDYSKSDRESVAVVRDAELADLDQTITKLKILQRYIDKLTWLLAAATK